MNVSIQARTLLNAWVVGTIAAILAASTSVCGSELTTRIGTGTGFVVSSDGYILTNEHVIHGAKSVSVTVNGSPYAASVVRASEAKDLALLKVNGHGLPVIVVGTSRAARIGDTVYAVGCPRGICGTLSMGTVANLGVIFEGVDVAFVMMDLTITHGNSGGPLLNEQGEAIGVTSAGLLSSSTADASETGYSFAIPIDEADSLLALIPGMQRSEQAQPGGALEAQAIRDKVGNAVAYVESRSEIPLASFLPTTVAGYGVASAPEVWTAPPPPPPPDPRLVKLCGLLGASATRLLSTEEQAEVYTIVRELLETGAATPLRLCQCLPGTPSSAQCSAFLSKAVGAPIEVKIPFEDLLQEMLLQPPVSPNPMFLDTKRERPAGLALKSVLSRLSVKPLTYAHSTISGAWNGDFLVAILDDTAIAESERAKIADTDLEGMTTIASGTLTAGTITAIYQIGYDITRCSWTSVVDADSSLLR